MKIKSFLSFVLASLAALAAVPSMAQTATGPDYTVLMNAVNWTTTNAAIMSLGAGLMVLFILMKGVKILHRFIKGA
jgi:hypothetical protein